MKRSGQPAPMIFLMLMALSAQLACGLSPEAAVSDLGSIDCAAKGGVWRQEVDSNGRLEEWCDVNITPTPINSAPETTSECIAPKTTYQWSYEDLKSSSGTGGIACNARLVFVNAGSDPVRLMLYESWDNNAMSSSGWENYSIPPGGIHEKRVSRTIYTDGVITFDRVEKMLVIRDLPGCVEEIPSISQASEWADAAEEIDDISCR